MSGIGWVTLGLLLALVTLAPARWAVLGLIAGVLYMTQGQAITLFDLNIYPMRVLTFAAFARVLARGEWSFARVNGVDKMVLLAYGYRTVIFIVNANGTPVTAIALMIDVSLAYFACRGLFHSLADLEWILRGLAVMLLPYVALLYVESTTGSNPFAAVGGVDQLVTRNGRPRCVGSFAHATILGTFGASFIPLYVALTLVKGSRFRGILGLMLCLAIVYFSNSGGPLSCALLAFIGWTFWYLRSKMLIVRKWIAAVMVGLIVLMEAPIWYLPAKISDLTGGDGWHRSYLMDIAIRQLDRWWLAGMPVVDTRPWFPYWVASGGADLINYYLDFGIAAGLGAIILFCLMLVKAFGTLGKSLRQVRGLERDVPGAEYILWALGVVLSIHIFNWFGLVYFDQYYTIFFIQLAAISTLSERILDMPPLKPFKHHTYKHFD